MRTGGRRAQDTKIERVRNILQLYENCALTKRGPKIVHAVKIICASLVVPDKFVSFFNQFKVKMNAGWNVNSSAVCQLD